MKRFEIYFWHGLDEKLAAKLEDFCDKVGPTYFYSGTLDSFAEEYKGKFIFLPETDEAQAKICITKYNSFGMR